MKQEGFGRALPLSPEALDRQTAMQDARMVLGIIDVLEHLDDGSPEDPLGAKITRLEKWLDQPPVPDASLSGRQIFGDMLG